MGMRISETLPTLAFFLSFADFGALASAKIFVAEAGGMLPFLPRQAAAGARYVNHTPLRPTVSAWYGTPMDILYI